MVYQSQASQVAETHKKLLHSYKWEVDLRKLSKSLSSLWVMIFSNNHSETSIQNIVLRIIYLHCNYCIASMDLLVFVIWDRQIKTRFCLFIFMEWEHLCLSFPIHIVSTNKKSFRETQIQHQKHWKKKKSFVQIKV